MVVNIKKRRFERRDRGRGVKGEISFGPVMKIQISQS